MKIAEEHKNWKMEETILYLSYIQTANSSLRRRE